MKFANSRRIFSGEFYPRIFGGRPRRRRPYFFCQKPCTRPRPASRSPQRADSRPRLGCHDPRAKGTSQRPKFRITLALRWRRRDRDRGCQVSKLLTAILACAAPLTACGYSAPDTVEIFVETTPPGAECDVSQPGSNVGRIASTPGIVLVPNIEADYHILCNRNGYQSASATVRSLAVTTPLLDYVGMYTGVRPTGGAALRVALSPR